MVGRGRDDPAVVGYPGRVGLEGYVVVHPQKDRLAGDIYVLDGLLVPLASPDLLFALSMTRAGLGEGDSHRGVVGSSARGRHSADYRRHTPHPNLLPQGEKGQEAAPH